MSCTVVAVPYALIWVVGAITTAAVSAAERAAEMAAEKANEKYNSDIFNLAAEGENCIEDKVITENHFIEKTFETPFMDETILTKTLEEHGMTNITKWENGLSGEMENYKLIFEKPSFDKPYNLRITCLEQDNAEDKVNDISGEYALNVQEDAYLHIIDKLKENNMQIEEEEVMEDNTIVLTVNID